MPNEVRYEMLRPAQAVARRKACPLAYLPVGIIEWHGPQNPLGLDGLGVHGICVRAADIGGGVVFPVPWYGENRGSHLAEVNPLGCKAIAAEMELPPDNFQSGYMGGRSAAQQANFYQELLYHIYYQIRSLGFEAIYVMYGHGPLRPYVALTTEVFERDAGVKMDFSDAMGMVEGVQIDHAGRVETGMMMGVSPELVDLSALPKGDKSKLVGIAGDDPREGSEEFGKAFVPASAAALAKRAALLLKRPPSDGALRVN